MTLYEAVVGVEDDPYSGSGRVIVEAASRSEARRLARRGALDAYYAQSGGWALKPKAVIYSLTQLDVQPRSVLMASIHSDR